MDCIIHISRDSTIANSKVVRSFFANHKPGKYLVTSKSLTRRTGPQNNYLHLLFSMCVEPLRDAGWNNIRNTEDAKEFIKGLFLKETVVNEKTGDEVVRIRGTSELNKEEMAAFIDDIMQWAAEYLNICLPEAGEPIKMF